MNNESYFRDLMKNDPEKAVELYVRTCEERTRFMLDMCDYRDKVQLFLANFNKMAELTMQDVDIGDMYIEYLNLRCRVGRE